MFYLQKLEVFVQQRPSEINDKPREKLLSSPGF
jgi:hypothetical protein